MSWAEAVPQEFSAQEEYDYTDGKLGPDEAKEEVRKRALRSISEQAGVYVSGISEVKNGMLTRDEIKTITSAIIKVENGYYDYDDMGHTGMKVRYYVTATVDPDDLQKILKDSGVQKMQSENERMKELLANTQLIIQQYENDLRTYGNGELAKDYLDPASAVYRLLLLDPKNKYAWGVIGFVSSYGSRFKDERHLNFLKKEVQKYPENPLIWYALAETLGKGPKSVEWQKAYDLIHQQYMEREFYEEQPKKITIVKGTRVLSEFDPYALSLMDVLEQVNGVDFWSWKPLEKQDNGDDEEIIVTIPVFNPGSGADIYQYYPEEEINKIYEFYRKK